MSTRKLVDAMRKDAVRMSVEPVRVTRNGRRYFSAAHKRAVIEQAMAPGASLAAVSMAHGFNANLVRKWVRQHRARRAEVPEAARLLPVILGESVPTSRRKRTTRAPSRTRRLPEAPSRAWSGVEIHVGEARVIVGLTPDTDTLRTVLHLLMRDR